MPLMNGMELLKQIQILSDPKPIVVIMTCGGANHKDEAFQNGAAGFFDKGDGFTIMIDFIKNHISIPEMKQS